MDIWYRALTASAPAAGGSGALLVDLISYWSLEEASGTRYDAHGSNDLAPVNAPGSTTGKKGDAAAFVAASGHRLSVADNATLDLSGGFTVAVWAKATALSGFQAIAVKDDEGADREFSLRFFGASPFVFCFNAAGASAELYPASVTLSTGTWYFFVAGWDPVAGRLHLRVNDGAVTAVDDALSGPLRDGDDPFVLGSGLGGNIPLDGAIDEVGLWSRWLTDDEQTWLYNSGAGRAYTDLATY